MAALAVLAAVAWTRPAAAAIASRDVGGGLLVVAGEAPDGAEVLPLAHTRVRAHLVASVARVEVRQTFNNPFDEPLEAVYVFPLPDDAAVAAMNIRIGERTITGLIKERAEARALYEEARRRGKPTALLDQERPNIFTQSVANIPPRAEVIVEITYDVALRYADGAYEFVYPMVVGPRYIPGTPTRSGAAPSGGGTVKDTDAVPDASRITPPVRKPGSRSGHDIAIDVTLDGGIPAESLSSPTHTVKVDKQVTGGRRATKVALAASERIPNRDFVLRYRHGGDAVAPVVATHRSAGGGYLALVIEPPSGPPADAGPGKELVFLVDTSSSMSGEPMALAKRALRAALAELGANDTFRILRFADGIAQLDEAALPATAANIRRGLSYVNGLRADGSTESVAAIRAALAPRADADRLRVICVLTDGLSGDERAILAEVARGLDADTRLFALGVGSSVNRYLVERMAELGRGAAQVLLLDERPDEAIAALFRRLRAPVATHLTVDWGTLPVRHVVPASLPDLFAGQPVVVWARYDGPAEGTVTIRGRRGAGPVTFSAAVALPDRDDGNEALARIWARSRIRALMNQQVRGEQPALVAEVTRLALQHRLVSPYTSFVAIEERVVNEGGVSRVVQVPVEMPEGVSYEAVFDDDRREIPSAGSSASPRVERDLQLTGATSEGVALSRSHAARAGQWRLGMGLGLGAVVAGELGDTAAIGALHARLDRVMTRRFAAGAEVALLVPGLDPRDTVTQLLAELSVLRLLELVELTVGAGASLDANGGSGIGYLGALELALPLRGPLDLGVQLRFDGMRPLGDDAGHRGALTLGLELGF